MLFGLERSGYKTLEIKYGLPRVAATRGSMACVVTSGRDVMCLIAEVFSLVIHSELQRHYLCGCSLRSRHRIVDIASIADTSHGFSACPLTVAGKAPRGRANNRGYATNLSGLSPDGAR